MIRKLRNVVPNADKLLDAFSANLAKWRYETVDVIMVALLKLRNICEKFFDRSWFPNPQDAAELDAFVYACGWKELWRFLAIAHKFGIQKFEKSRRWGLVCHLTNYKSKWLLSNFG
jgi:hypothetical protein